MLEQPTHFSEFKRNPPHMYPFARIGSWVTSNEGMVYPVTLDANIFDSRVATGQRLYDFLKDQGIKPNELYAIGTHGSNASPAVVHKFSKTEKRPGLPYSMVTLAGTAHNRDVVLESRISLGGSVPVSIIEQDGTTVDFYLNLLSKEQVERMHATEACAKDPGVRTYELTCLPNITLQNGQTVPFAYAYAARGSLFTQDGNFVAPASQAYEKAGTKAGIDFTPVNATGRKLKEATQREVMEWFDQFAQQHYRQPLYERENNVPVAVHVELQGGKGTSGREKLDRIRGSLQEAFGRSYTIDVETVEDPWNFETLTTFEKLQT